MEIKIVKQTEIYCLYGACQRRHFSWMPIKVIYFMIHTWLYHGVLTIVNGNTECRSNRLSICAIENSKRPPGSFWETLIKWGGKPLKEARNRLPNQMPKY